MTMARTMRHRGPDDEGVFISTDRRTGLGFQRLAIVDLSSAGHQPMCNRDGTLWISFNGEIYNHADSRRSLVQEGYTYRSRTDTETILYLYEKYGNECVTHLRGMFAFAIWDERKQVLFLARDRLGIKPLYYMQVGGNFIFGSEIKALLAFPDVKRDINPEALYHYLTFMVTPPPLTMFEGLHKLPAGHRMTVDADGNITVDQYWDAIVPTAPRNCTYSYFVTRTADLLKQSVGMRMMSDVPVGAFLSGGVDSSTIVALMSECVDRPISTFTVGFERYDVYNEFSHAQKVAQLFQTDHHEIMISHRDALDYLPDLVRSQDEPISDWVSIPLYFVSKLAKESGVKVVQVGEGADELFCGYPAYLRSLSWQRWIWPWLRLAPPPLWTVLGTMVEVLASHGARRAGNTARLLRRLSNEDGRFWGGAVVLRGPEKEELLDMPFWRSQPHLDSALVPHSAYQRLAESKPSAGPLELMTYLELKQRLPELLLMRVDKVTMSTSVEARVPFLDHELVEFLMSVPQRVKIKGGQTKPLLKAVAEQLLPTEIVHRPKMGFGAPVSEWFRAELAPEARSVLLDGRIHEREYFNRDYIRAMLDQHQSGHRDWAVPLWNLFNLALWYEAWL